MDRTFTEKEVSTLINNCLTTNTNLLPYCCKENIDAWWLITRCISVVKQYDIIPAHYWHGNYGEFTQLLSLLSSGYPNPEALLYLARTKTTCTIQNIANHFFQRAVAMFDLHKKYHGYVLLRPTEYMQRLYPNSEGMIYVYSDEKWTHNEGAEIDNPVFVFREDEITSFPEMLKKKLKIF